MEKVYGLGLCRTCYDRERKWKDRGININTANRIENLELKTIKDHNKDHAPLLSFNTQCSYCKKEFRVRPWKSKKKYLFCSRKCIGLFNFYQKSKS